MRIGIPLESQPGETRVAATPKTVTQLVQLGYDVEVESGAGLLANYHDSAYAAAGATIGDRASVFASDVVCKVTAPSSTEIAQLNDGATLVSLISPALRPDLVDELAERDITVLAMDAVPRISRAQALDVLSSMANIAGYRAIVEAANEFGSFFTGQVTAAGSVPPAKVLVVGAGVAGLAAIGTAKSLGAIVRATDARPEVAEQVESMGAEFLPVEVGQQEVSSDGYAKATSDDYNAAAARLYAAQAPEVDIIVTTALIPGRPAPRLITADMVAAMKPGSVIVDMAAANGGNVEGSVANERVVTPNGVIILGYTDLAGRLPTQASQLYGTNIVNLFKLLTPAKDGQLVVNFDDVVQRGMTVVRQGEKTWPPPPIQVSAAPVAKADSKEVVTPKKRVKQPPNPGRRVGLTIIISTLAAGVFWSSPETFLSHFMVFMLAVVVGYYVIGSVHHALHTPLMSVTNAISGIIILGALLQMGGDPSWIVKALAFVAILVASINIFGGFTVTHRMLSMFKRG
ncbi:MAG TPA: Re/Si-specific NAD(P)(+) transhydrogenase subunit alpha [Propionibacteriaceae bacterium]|nr:Re/Si-specific NAD(P)(+) transhydrogenase subunit alpha [Propionibacteriaceae bacterium]HPZ50115.1 Re/Si-specific NAD(P)(+) transhydrogenase subunit alpha [Propionibacteriaceae bacterium]HQE32063.1 Re/Si-specific NAD(P)(+) transhydrogenase subunit alpha [Propionibacteriaceae bacterium]